MLTAIAEFGVRRRKTVLAAVLGLFVVSGAFGGAQQHLSQGGFEDQQAESAAAVKILNDQFDAGPPNIVLLVEAKRGDVDASDVGEAGAALTQELADEPMVAGAVSRWTPGRPPPFKSASGDEALVPGRKAGNRNEVIQHMEELSPNYARDSGPIKVHVAGIGEAIRETSTTIEAGMARLEAITLPLTLLVLVLVFGSVVSAALPVAVGALAMVTTFLILRVAASVGEVSVYSLWRSRTRRTNGKAVELGGLDLFRTCRPADLRVVASVTDDATFAAGDVLCRQGRVAYECFVIAAGRVEVRVNDRPVAVLGQGDVVGETAILDGGLRTATVVAVTDVRVFVIDRRRLEDLLERVPAIALQMLKQLAKRLRHVDSKLVAAQGRA